MAIEGYFNYLSNEGSLSIVGLLVKQSDSSKDLSLQIFNFQMLSSIYL